MSKTYTPLTTEQLKELHASQPKQDRLITVEQIQDRITDVIFTDVVDASGVLSCTVCLIKLDNGFETLGRAYVVDVENYVRELGEHYAYQDAFKNLWGPMAFSIMENDYLDRLVSDDTRSGLDSLD